MPVNENNKLKSEKISERTYIIGKKMPAIVNIMNA